LVTGTGVGEGVGRGVGDPTGLAEGLGLGTGVGEATGFAEGLGVGDETGCGEGRGVGPTVGFCVGVTTGAGVGVSKQKIIAVTIWKMLTYMCSRCWEPEWEPRSLQQPREKEWGSAERHCATQRISRTNSDEGARYKCTRYPENCTLPCNYSKHCSHWGCKTDQERAGAHHGKWSTFHLASSAPCRCTRNSRCCNSHFHILPS
jgi:hypothetical protein